MVKENMERILQKKTKRTHRGLSMKKGHVSQNAGDATQKNFQLPF